jgi:glycosyltransferase involved in cell wall biosynthesis
VPRILTATDLFALTSHNEANPVSILEAMSVGRPVVATDVGSIHETVTDGETGLLVPPGDAARFAECVVQLLCDPLRGQAMGTAARRQVVKHWSLEQMTRGYEQLIEATHCRKATHPGPVAEVAKTSASHRAAAIPATIDNGPPTTDN